MIMTLKSLHALRTEYDEANPVACQAVDAELERRHAASLRKERRNLASWKIKESK
jgi:hypothetical protein